MSTVSPDTSRETATPLTDGCNNNQMVNIRPLDSATGNHRNWHWPFGFGCCLIYKTSWRHPNGQWTKRQFSACQISRSMYPSIFNSFSMLKSMRIVQKSQFLPHFSFPWGRPWGNHAKCCMDGKRTRCLQIVSLHVPICLLLFLRYSEIFVKNIVILSYLPCIRRPR